MSALGRLVEHDPRSKAFPADVTGVVIHDVLHQRHVPVFDQGDLGSCTGNAAAGCMASGPWTHKTTEKDAVTLYERATHLDGIAGVYPPNDTGSSGLAVMKAVRENQWIGAYHHCFSLHACLAALQTTPVIAGVNWYEGFDHPAPDGTVRIAGGVRGGHEVCLLGVDVEHNLIRAVNSWGSSWGDKGFFSWTWADFDRLLHEHGDVTVPVP